MGTEQHKTPACIRTDLPLRLNPALVKALANKTLGLPRTEVRLANSSPKWEQAFTEVQRVLLGNKPLGVQAIEHIGSTAVPGLSAKPILDIIIGTVPEAGSDELHRWLLGHGFIYRGEADAIRPDTIYGFEIEANNRLINAHVITYGQTEWAHYLNFRNYLRRTPQDREAYQRLKEQLAATHAHDRISYLEGKTEFITQHRKAQSR
ncbi:GrpB family protein [Glutamicibacter sp.]|uniref:GrpB family protein n=1 Tax=Glutamicibacter sp. TaxID=1931995 RepID=UPI0028BD41A9|nr:GrpB family protein [Glutamicibacter sp.]